MHELLLPALSHQPLLPVHFQKCHFVNLLQFEMGQIAVARCHDRRPDMTIDKDLRARQPSVLYLEIFEAFASLNENGLAPRPSD